MAGEVNLNQALSAYNNASKIVKNAASDAEDAAASGAAGAAGAANRPSFTDLVGDALNQAIATEYKGESLSAKAIAGQADLHELVTAVSNAELTLNTVVAVRDRVINAYQDIVKMPI